MTACSLTYRGAFRALSAPRDSWQFWCLETGLDENGELRHGDVVRGNDLRAP